LQAGKAHFLLVEVDDDLASSTCQLGPCLHDVGDFDHQASDALANVAQCAEFGADHPDLDGRIDRRTLDEAANNDASLGDAGIQRTLQFAEQGLGCCG
jgi:hypothetical protein